MPKKFRECWPRFLRQAFHTSDASNERQEKVKYILWPTIGVGNENADVDTGDGEDDTEQCNWREFADKLDTDKHTDEHQKT